MQIITTTRVDELAKRVGALTDIAQYSTKAALKQGKVTEADVIALCSNEAVCATVSVLIREQRTKQRQNTRKQNKKISEAEAKIDCLETRVTTLQQNLVEAERSRKALREEVAALKQRQAAGGDISQEFRHLKQRVLDLVKERDDLHKRLTAAQSNLLKESKRLDKLRMESLAEIERLSASWDQQFVAANQDVHAAKSERKETLTKYQEALDKVNKQVAAAQRLGLMKEWMTIQKAAEA